MALLMAADIVITNPPFSLFREYIKQLMEYNKKFIVLGNQNAVTCKEIFPLIKSNDLWLGYSIHSGDVEFEVPSDYECHSKSYRVEDGKCYLRVPGIRWFTNLENNKCHYKMDLYKLWSRCADEYQHYDNYDAINVDKTCDIPLGYKGVMGVPITFLDKYCPEQFEILWMTSPNINGQKLYKRIFIRFRDGEGEEPDLTKDWR